MVIGVRGWYALKRVDSWGRVVVESGCRSVTGGGRGRCVMGGQRRSVKCAEGAEEKQGKDRLCDKADKRERHEKLEPSLLHRTLYAIWILYLLLL